MKIRIHYLCSNVLAIGIPLVLGLGLLNGCGGGGASTINNNPPPPQVTYVAVTDTNNNRVLIFDSSFTTGMSASVTLGGSGLTASGMDTPLATAIDSAGNLYVADAANNRVLQFKPRFTSGMNASLAIGQPNLTTGQANTTVNGLGYPSGMVFDGSGNLWVADVFNNRVLEYQPPFATGMNASMVLGQSNFTSNGGNLGSAGLLHPRSLAMDATGNLWVVDSSNNRVLEYEKPFTSGMAASLVIGQTGFVAFVGADSANGLDYPFGIAFDSAGDLWVGDVYNNRVLEFKPPFSTGMSANLVLGQTGFTEGTSATTQNGFDEPFGISFDGSGNLWVTDNQNNRTLEFSSPFTNNQNASLVLGQANFTTGTATSTSNGMSRPLGVMAF
ncbi:MAG: NHL repeat-containing protein [Terracidiphilus sp.]